MPPKHREIITPREFRAYCKDNQDTRILKAGTVLARDAGNVVVKTVGNADDRVMQFISSSGEIDRYGDTIASGGWDLKHYQAKGLFLWGHNLDGVNPPIGQGQKAFVKNALLHIQVKWLDADFADHDWVKFTNMLFRMYTQGIMHDVSIGMLPLEWRWADENDDTRSSWDIDFLEQELLELSAVPIGANREVDQEDVGKEFVAARAAGIDVAPAVRWAERQLDEAKGNEDDVIRRFHEKLRAPAVQVTNTIEVDNAKQTDSGAGDVGEAGLDTPPHPQVMALQAQVDKLEATVRDLAVMVQTGYQSAPAGDQCCSDDSDSELQEQAAQTARKAASAVREAFDENWKVPFDGRID